MQSALVIRRAGRGRRDLGLGPPGNSPGLMDQVGLQGPSCFSQWIWGEHFLCARHGVSRDKNAVSVLKGSVTLGAGQLTTSSLCDLVKPRDLAEPQCSHR